MAHPWRPASEIEENPVNLPEDAAAEIVPQLNAHLSSFFVLFHQYQKHHWLVERPQFRDVHLFLEESYNELHKDLDAIAERVTAIGGVPTGAPDQQVREAYIEHEPEGVFRIRAMLERDRTAEGALAEQLRRIVKLCTSRGDFGTETLLKGVLLRVEDRAHHLDHFLGEDSLGLALGQPAGASE